MEAAKLLAAGRARAEVAGLCGVSWRSAHEWRRVWSKEGAEALRAKKKPGPGGRFSEEDMAVLARELRRGPVAHGCDNDLWSLPRAGRLITETFHRKASPSEVWRWLRRMGWSPQKPKRLARERDGEKIAEWKDPRWRQLKTKAQKERRTIVFADESGRTQKPAAKSTWAPEGQTPVLELNFHWKKLSVIGGIPLKSLCFNSMKTRSKRPRRSLSSGICSNISRANCRSSGMACRRTAPSGRPITAPPPKAGSGPSGCRVMPRNSIRSNISGVTPKATIRPTSRRRSLGN